MFKEFFAGAAVLAFVYVLLRIIYKKNNNTLPFFHIAALMVILCAASLLYNLFNIYPNAYMETKTGTYRYGTFSENLFAYSEEFRYRDEILFPILRNRTVELDSNGSFYKRFFSLFSKEVSENGLDIPESKREYIISNKDHFDYETEFNCIGLMDYATESIPADLEDTFSEKIFPHIYINTASLKNNSSLVVMVDKDYTVYLMGKSYYDTIVT